MSEKEYVQYQISRYWMYFFSQATRQPARVLLYGVDGKLRGDVWFLADGVELPGPVVSSQEGKSGAVEYEVKMYHPMHQLLPLVDILRHEDPINLYFNPRNGKGGIVTGVEAVGEGE